MNLIEEKIIKILEDPIWDWRTLGAILKGVAELTDDGPAVIKLLEEMEKHGIIVHAYSPNSSERVYTTLRHYKATHSFKDISLSSLSGSIQY